MSIRQTPLASREKCAGLAPGTNVLFPSGAASGRIQTMNSPVVRSKHLVVLACSCGALAVQGQINLSTLSYSQDFDTLGASGTWSDNVTLPGWHAANNNAGVVTPYAAFSNTAGGGTSSGTLYSMATSSADTDRALGGAPASARYTILGLRLVNDTGSVFDGVNVTYDLEQWSDRGTATVILSYQTFAAGAGSLLDLTGWTTLRSDNGPLPTNPTPANGIGNTTGLLAGLSAGIGSLGLQNGEELWLRWEITKLGGNNATHGIDNVTVVVPEPAVAGWGALALAGLWLRRRMTV